MLSKFNNEVLSKGPTAVLPQNLSAKWLKTLQEISEDFFDGNFSLDECKDVKDAADPILLTCVYEILREQYPDTGTISPEEMIEKIAIYAISITMEAVQRESDIGLEPPDLENILSLDRIRSFKTVNSDFIQLLEQACLIRNPETG